MDAVPLGREMASWRRAAGLTQAELARRMGTSQSVISRTEAGRCLPGLPLLLRFAQATGRSRIVLEVMGTERTPSREERRRRVRRVLGDYVFDPWERRPTPAEARSLIADGLTVERFSRKAAAAAGSKRA
jgi:transcriptional regulator with XRE-family HTH domain